MRANWKTAPINEFYHGLYDGPHATPKPADAGPVFLGIKNLTDDGHLDFSGIRHIAEEDYSNWTRRIEPRPGDIVFTYEATLNRYAIIPNGFRGCLGRRMALIRTNPEKVDTLFLFYYFFSPAWREVIRKNTMMGATVDRIPLIAFPNFPITVPPLREQRQISSTLSAYDDLIKNSQRRINILEKMTRDLYREWFIHFRFPGHENHLRIATSHDDLPQGWEMKKLGDVADISWGDTSTTKASYRREGYSAYSASGLDGKLDHYDFDRVGIVLSAIGAQCGKTWLARGKWSCIKNTIRFWSKNECVSTEFLFIATEGLDFWPRRGAAQPFISQGDAKRIAILTPDRATMKLFTSFAATALETIATLELQINILHRVRDTLLPRLLSGQVQFPIEQ